MIKKIYKSLVPEKKRNKIRYLIFKAKSIFYIGNNKTCNCCNKSFRFFLTYGNIPRLNALCPYCHSLERTRLLLFYLKKETNIFNGGYKVLHFAPEPIIESTLKKTNNLYISADINSALAEHVIDATSIPYPENTFDFVICSHVLGHIPDESKAINEIYRVLKPKGRAIFLTVIDSNLEHTYENEHVISDEDKLNHYGESDLVRRHGRDFEQRLQRTGVLVEKKPYFLSFSEEDRIRYSLGNGDREMIFNCTKK